MNATGTLEDLSGADVEYLGEELTDVVSHGRNKCGNGGEVRLAVTTEGDESDMLTTSAFYMTTADDALGVGKQYDFKQHGRWVSIRASQVGWGFNPTRYDFATPLRGVKTPPYN
ncbi:MAG: hypothetical protein U1C48_03050 [Methylotenera sp.]|nr:hypothetical protein [Methylotenera sp.]